MDNEKILNIFKKFIDNYLNIHGLILIPVKVEQSFKRYDRINIYFDLENPNNSSYLSTVVQDHIYDETEQFEPFINKKIDVFFTPNVKLGLNLNGDTLSKVEKIFDSVKVIEFTIGPPLTGYLDAITDKKYKLFVKSIGVETSYYDDESFYIYNKVKVLRATLDGKTHNSNDVIKEYVDNFLLNKETYYETETYYSEVDRVLNSKLINATNESVAGYYDTKFIR